MSAVDPKTRLRLYQAIGPWLSGQNDSYSNFDDNGYFLRGASSQGPEGAELPCTGDAGNCAVLRRVMQKVMGVRK